MSPVRNEPLRENSAATITQTGPERQRKQLQRNPRFAEQSRSADLVAKRTPNKAAPLKFAATELGAQFGEERDDNAAVDAAELGGKAVERTYRFTTSPTSKPNAERRGLNETQAKRLNFGDAASEPAKSANKSAYSHRFADPRNTPHSPKTAQKRRVKRQYAAVRNTKQAVKTSVKTAKVLKKSAATAGSHPGVTLAVVIVLLTTLLLAAIAMSLVAVASGAVPNAAGMYMNDGLTLTNADLLYSEWEVDLKISASGVNGIIRHNPLQLAAYLTAKLGEFTPEQARAELAEVFAEQYAVSETGYVTALPFSDVLESKLDASELAAYHLLLSTGVGVQLAASPLGTEWLPYLTSGFGYRLSPFGDGKGLHKGLDIGFPTGTPILAAHDGIVTVRYDENGYGNYIVLTGADGIVTKYAHCSVTVAVTGQSVRAGDMIALVGSTGASTGPHLHFEVLKDGEYINPIFVTALKP
jgi:murein DD-endopeptidase MepM/ murein hydrolase activator NlpD